MTQHHTFSVYSGNGNIVGIVPLRTEEERGRYNNFKLRKELAEWGIARKVDSIMVLSENRNGSEPYFMDVFEPRGIDESGMAGSWSTMCGNGIMAVARYYEDTQRGLKVGEQIHIGTKSGVRTVTKMDEGKYGVVMGECTHDFADLSGYTNLRGLVDADLFQLPVPPKFHIPFSSISICLSGNRKTDGVIDGEPHAVVIYPEDATLTSVQLRRQAVLYGPAITKNNSHFPHEINANFVCVQDIDREKFVMNVLACTHERGLGSDPDHSVTDACGTGATAVAATLYRIYSLPEKSQVRVRMPGGVLTVYKENGLFTLIGEAHAV